MVSLPAQAGISVLTLASLVAYRVVFSFYVSYVMRHIAMYAGIREQGAERNIICRHPRPSMTAVEKCWHDMLNLGTRSDWI